MRELYRSDHYLIELDDARRILIRRRTERGYRSTEELGRTQEEAIRVLNSVGRSRFAQLVDLRLAPPRNDPDFEQAMARYRAQLNDGFRALAYVLRTEAGRLQLTRLGSHAGGRIQVFLDEREAIAYLAAVT